VIRQRTVLLTLDWPDRYLATVEAELAPAQIVRRDRRDRAGIARDLRHANVALLADDPDASVTECTGLEWLHVDHAGIERSARPELLARGVRVTSSSGRSAPALAEHAFFFLLALTYRVDGLLAAQRQRRWDQAVLAGSTALRGATLGLIGLGHTGREVVERAAAFGMRIIVHRRRDVPAPPGVERVDSSDRGDTPMRLLAESDAVVLACSLNDRSHHLIGAAELATMKRSAVLVNVARGALVDETALARALRRKEIAGAGLDVFAVEPLPRSSPLWRAPNLLVTPHLTPPLADRVERSAAIVLANATRFREGRPLLNALTMSDAYTGPSAATGPSFPLRLASRTLGRIRTRRSRRRR